MDPTATLNRIFGAIAEGNWDEVYWTSIELEEWLSNGGFVPERHSRNRLIGFCYTVRQKAKGA